MSKYYRGQELRIIADGFEIEPHGLEIGEIVEFNAYEEAIPWEDLGPADQRILISNGHKIGDPAPATLHVHYYGVEGIENNFGPLCLNVLESDVEVLEDDEGWTLTAEFNPNPTLKEGSVVEMLEDCFDDGFSAGDRFTINIENTGNEEVPCFIDKDGDQRVLEFYKHKVISY